MPLHTSVGDSPDRVDRNFATGLPVKIEVKEEFDQILERLIFVISLVTDDDQALWMCIFAVGTEVDGGIGVHD